MNLSEIIELKLISVVLNYQNGSAHQTGFQINLRELRLQQKRDAEQLVSATQRATAAKTGCRRRYAQDASAGPAAATRNQRGATELKVATSS